MRLHGHTIVFLVMIRCLRWHCLFPFCLILLECRRQTEAQRLLLFIDVLSKIFWYDILFFDVSVSYNIYNIAISLQKILSHPLVTIQ